MSAHGSNGRLGDWLVVEDLHRHFDGHAAVNGVSFALDEGEIGVLLGPSGCGKTTTLRCIAGFESPDRGRIRARGRVLVGEGRALEPHERGIGFVFQDGALFPHLTVRGNVEFGLHALPAAERRGRVDELLAALDLGALAGRHPAQLSGGQQQRVALARALAPRPDTILLDEPFSSLDPSLRERLAVELRDWLRHFGVTALVVTHDQHEALGLADRIGVMHAGRLEQWASPYEIYHRPATRFVAGFVGQGVLLPAGSRAVANSRPSWGRSGRHASAVPSARTARCCCAPTTSCPMGPAPCVAGSSNERFAGRTISTRSSCPVVAACSRSRPATTCTRSARHWGCVSMPIMSSCSD